jgi:flagellin-like hook-associated protein FlgL
LLTGQTATITATLSEATSDFAVGDITVAGGAVSSFAGSGTIYTFTFTPTANSTTSMSISVQAGSFADAFGNTNSASNTLGATVDTAAPSVTGVSSSSADGPYRAGATLSITVVFNDVVTVSTGGGVPTLLLETGTTDTSATYSSGSGTDTLTFRYVVQAGNTSSDLDQQSNEALALNGGTIRDASGNDAVLTLASPAASGSLGANKAIVIDTVAPSAPTSLAATAIGGTVVANTLLASNTNMTATASITAGQATGGSAELLLGSAVIATDASISSGDTSVSFTLGLTTTAQLQAAIASGGVLTARLIDLAGNISASSTSVSGTRRPSRSSSASAGSRNAFIHACIDSGRVTDPSLVQSDKTYTLSFLGDAASGFQVQITRDPAGTPALDPNPRAYVPGQAIEFDGIAVTVSGVPAPGRDAFKVEASQPDLSVFDVLDRLTTELGAPGRTGAQVAQTVQDGLRDLDSTMGSLMTMRSNLGWRMEQADGLSSRWADGRFAAQSERSAAEDLDMVEAISGYQNKQTSYDAALKAYAMVQRLSLFEYIR